ncbi:ABC transporter substrate-binding protein [Pelagovum pacificum]|uniref:ABC transporter substrate-binding protein n=1 Tax=Pelagovum pacificum TaxID=2588711 RepID=A0A5C5G915_9RHOB|nr:ABC transporter substrate-binding protein [Pelagovum pacificum]QQA41984.1 ABC transporter substrate-binding protein [Pelagovum pacificum]TNY30575.1 ABC transporter substrate-binding protein [Pelagovum pacificum]
MTVPNRVTAVLMTALLAGPVAAQGTAEDGVVNFAADFAAAPNQFIRTDGEMDGLNVDMCGAVAEKMGDEIEWTNLAFPGLVPGLQANRFDAICTAIFINPERLQIMNMISYVQWGEGLMVPEGNPAGISCEAEIGTPESYEACFDGLAGMTVSVAAGGTTNTHLVEQSDRMEEAGLDPIDIRAFDSNSETIQAVTAGQADAGYLNDPQAAYFISSSGAPFEMAFTGFAANQLAIATLKDNTELADRILAALEELRADGSYDEIVETWGVAAVPEFVLNPSE